MGCQWLGRDLRQGPLSPLRQPSFPAPFRLLDAPLLSWPQPCGSGMPPRVSESLGSGSPGFDPRPCLCLLSELPLPASLLSCTHVGTCGDGVQEGSAVPAPTAAPSGCSPQGQRCAAPVAHQDPGGRCTLYPQTLAGAPRGLTAGQTVGAWAGPPCGLVLQAEAPICQGSTGQQSPCGSGGEVGSQ